MTSKLGVVYLASMADNVLDAMQPEEFEDSDEFGLEATEEQRGRFRDRVSGFFRKLTSPFIWFRDRIVFFWRWLFKPNEVGKPVTLRPSGVRVLILLIVGNIAILGLLGYALYQTATMPPVAMPVFLSGL